MRSVRSILSGLDKPHLSRQLQKRSVNFMVLQVIPGRRHRWKLPPYHSLLTTVCQEKTCLSRTDSPRSSVFHEVPRTICSYEKSRDLSMRTPAQDSPIGRRHARIQKRIFNHAASQSPAMPRARETLVWREPALRLRSQTKAPSRITTRAKMSSIPRPIRSAPFAPK